MKHLLAALLYIAALGAGAAYAQGTPTVVTPSDVKWTAGTGPLAGTQVAVIMGNPDQAGPYVIRIKAPDGTKIMPHTHSEVENVTVLQGTLMIGLGDTMDPSKMTAVPAGSFVSVPSGLHHFAMTKGETIIQVNAIGPRSMTPVKP
jgi:quercetin dioxygenase-like cupin family protein